MRKRDNFYFWASWVSTGSLVLIIFYLYQQKYSFEDTIDVKTLLNVGGVLGGAFFGAFLAGRYSLQAVDRQIKHQEEKEKVNVLKTTLKIMKMYESQLKIILGNTSEEALESLRKNYTKNKPPFYEDLYDFIKGVSDDLKNIDISNVDIEYHLLLLDAIRYGESCRVEFKNLERFAKANKVQDFLDSLGNLEYFNGKMDEIFICIIDEQEKLEKLI